MTEAAAVAKLQAEYDKKMAAALARAEAAKGEVAAKGAKLGGGGKYEAKQAADAAKAEGAKAATEARQAAALTRADEVKAAAAAKATAEIAKVGAAREVAKAAAARRAAEQLVRLAARQVATAERKGAIDALKVATAQRLASGPGGTSLAGSPTKKRPLSPMATFFSPCGGGSRDATPDRAAPEDRFLCPSPMQQARAVASAPLLSPELRAKDPKSTLMADASTDTAPEAAEASSWVVLPPVPPADAAPTEALHNQPSLDEAPPPPPTAATAGKKGKIKVVTLRKDSPTGSHVVTMVSPATPVKTGRKESSGDDGAAASPFNFSA